MIKMIFVIVIEGFVKVVFFLQILKDGPLGAFRQYRFGRVASIIDILDEESRNIPVVKT